MKDTANKGQTAPRARRDRSRTRRRVSKLLAIGSVGAVGLRAVLKKHNASLHAAADSMSDTLRAPGTHDEPALPNQGDSDAHAGGHRHMPPSPRSTTPRLEHRAWQTPAPRADHTSHPPRA